MVLLDCLGKLSTGTPCHRSISIDTDKLPNSTRGWHIQDLRAAGELIWSLSESGERPKLFFRCHAHKTGRLP